MRKPLNRYFQLFFRSLHFQQTLTPSDPYNHDPGIIDPVNDAKRRLNKLAQPGNSQLRDDPAAFGEIGQLPHLCEYLAYQPHPDVRDLLLGIPFAD